MAGRLAEPGIIDPALALAQRVGAGGGELAEAVVGRGGGAGDAVDPTDRHRGLVAEGVVDGIGLEPQRRRAGLDHLLGQQARRGIIGEGRRPRAARRPCRARPDQPAQRNRRRHPANDPSHVPLPSRTQRALQLKNQCPSQSAGGASPVGIQVHCHGNW
jgi:hypothetical protein